VHESKVKGFYDQKEIEEVYYPESIELIKKVTGASKVVIFDHSVSPLMLFTNETDIACTD
jgi:hypothetical protein